MTAVRRSFAVLIVVPTAALVAVLIAARFAVLIAARFVAPAAGHSAFRMAPRLEFVLAVLPAGLVVLADRPAAQFHLAGAGYPRAQFGRCVLTAP